MTPERELAPLLADAVSTLKAAATESHAMRSALPGLLVERQQWEKGQRRLLRLVGALLLLLFIVIAYLVPLARRNAENLRVSAESQRAINESLRIIKSVTDPDAVARQQRQTAGLICQLMNDMRSVHDAPPAPGCPVATEP